MRRELALFRKVVALLKKIPVDFGQYEVRLFNGLTYNRAASSPPLTVSAP